MRTGEGRPPAQNAISAGARISEDWLAVAIGLTVFCLAFGYFFGVDLLGWAVTTSVWMNAAKALGGVGTESP